MAFSSDDDKAVKTALLSFFFQVKSDQEALDEWGDLPVGAGKGRK